MCTHCMCNLIVAVHAHGVAVGHCRPGALHGKPQPQHISQLCQPRSYVELSNGMLIFVLQDM